MEFRPSDGMGRHGMEKGRKRFVLSERTGYSPVWGEGVETRAVNLAPTAPMHLGTEKREPIFHALYVSPAQGLNGLSGRGGHLSKRDCGEPIVR